jgi:Autographiviridae endonuclease VII
MQKKRCFDCGKTKSVELFHRRANRNADGNYYSTQCLTCYDQDSLLFVYTTKRSDQFFYLNKYSLTERDFQIMFVRQKGVCAVCGSTNEKRNKLFVDHDHSTGKVRGLLCHACNVKLGKLRDNPPKDSPFALYLAKALSMPSKRKSPK